MNAPGTAADTEPDPPGYPAGLASEWQAPDGTRVVLRPLRPSDLEMELRFVRGLSEQTLYQRLQYAASDISPDQARQLLTMDYRDMLAFGAFVAGPDGQQLIGVSRYARIEATRRAECAIVVADEWQGLGLGTQLMRKLGDGARANTFAALEGLSLAENQRLRAWARRVGFDVRTEPHSGGLVRITLDLTAEPG